VKVKEIYPGNKEGVRSILSMLVKVANTKQAKALIPGGG